MGLYGFGVVTRTLQWVHLFTVQRMTDNELSMQNACLNVDKYLMVGTIVTSYEYMTTYECTLFCTLQTNKELNFLHVIPVFSVSSLTVQYHTRQKEVQPPARTEYILNILTHTGCTAHHGSLVHLV